MNTIKDTIKKSIERNIEKAQKIDATSHKQNAVRQLEKELGRYYVGTVKINNELNVSANIFTDPEKWTFKVNITYQLNGKNHFLQTEENMAAIDSPIELNRFIRSHVLDSLAKVITNETFRQNQRAFKSISKEYSG